MFEPGAGRGGRRMCNHERWGKAMRHAGQDTGGLAAILKDFSEFVPC